MLTVGTSDAGAPVIAVDDDPDIRDLIAAVLDQVGVAYRSVASGEEALAAAAAEKPKLFVLDVRMPGLDGLEVCREVKRRWGVDVAVLLLSAESSPADIAHGYAAGADDYLTKPFRTHELGHRVRSLLAPPAPEDVA